MSRITYMRSWKSLRLTSHTWLGLNPHIGRPLSRIVVPLVYFFFKALYHFSVKFKWKMTEYNKMIIKHKVLNSNQCGHFEFILHFEVLENCFLIIFQFHYPIKSKTSIDLRLKWVKFGRYLSCGHLFFSYCLFTQIL
jgi:hypothetical protein